MHEGAKYKQGVLLSRHELWKGIVEGIRTLPSHIHNEPLVNVRWFWSKSDIEAQFLNEEIEIPDCMRKCVSRKYNR
jgi:hypothetical protein